MLRSALRIPRQHSLIPPCRTTILPYHPASLLLPQKQSPPSRRHASTESAAAAAVVAGGEQAAHATTTSTIVLDAMSNLVRLPMEYLHDTLHVPWLWVIPLSALAIRAALFYPITLSTRQALQRRMAISPLISAHKPWYRNEARVLARRDPSMTMMAHNKRLLQKLTDDLKERYKCGLGKTLFRPMLQLPVFLQMSWTIREVLGIPGGTLKSFIYNMLGKGETAPAVDAAQQVAQAVEPTTAMEQWLPWTTDLTLADPTGTLSYVVSGIMLSQVLLSVRSAPGGSTMLSRTLMVLAVSIGPLMASAPAGILYYWACSSGLALLTNGYLDWRYPLVRFAPCKRPLRRNGLPPQYQAARKPARSVPGHDRAQTLAPP